MQEDWAQQYGEERGVWYGTELLVHEGYLADGEDDTDLLTLQAQLQSINVRPGGRTGTLRVKEASKQGHEAGDSLKSRGTGAMWNEQNRLPAQSDPNSDIETEWDSDDSLHVKPLSDISFSSGEDDIEPWRADIDSYRRVAIEHGADSGTDGSKAGRAKPSTKLSSARRTLGEPEPYPTVALGKERASRKRGSQIRKTTAQAGKDT